jgi:hypothetical protein
MHCILCSHCHRAHREAESRHYSTGDHSSAGAVWHQNDDADDFQQEDEVDEPEENSEEFIATALGAVSTSTRSTPCCIIHTAGFASL